MRKKNNINFTSRLAVAKKISIKALDFEKLPRKFNGANYIGNAFLNITRSSSNRGGKDNLTSSLTKNKGKMLFAKPLTSRSRNENAIKLNKLKASTEQDLQIEKDKYDEAMKQLEAKRKREEMEQKKKEAEAKDAKGKKKEERKQQEKKKAKGEKKVAEETVDDKPIVELKEKLDKINDDLNTLNNNKNINNDKKSKVQQFLAIFTKKFKERI